MTYRVITPDTGAVMATWNIPALPAAAIGASSLSDEQITELLNPSEQLTDSGCEALDRVCRRLMKARSSSEKVFTAGDYDADGICSTALMKDILDRLGIANGYYIPDRFKEGYGLSEATVKLAHEKGYSLIVTVDNGVKCFGALKLAKDLGMDVIVTDHHTIEEEVPCDILLHPDVMEPRYAFLSGAGVVLQISRKLFGDIPMHTAIAAIALIGDVMPVWRENRPIIRAGLRAIERGELPAVLPLLRRGSAVDETAVSYQIVPKLNSVARMNDTSNVNTVVPFLLCRRKDQIDHYASQLERVNGARRRRSDAMVKRALELENNDPFPVIFDETFFEGVNGIAAGRLAKTWHKPVLVFARHDDLLKGSGRSIEGFDMYSFFSGFEELEQFGGHTGAVGIAVKESRYEEFCSHVRSRMSDVVLPENEPEDPAFLIDADHLNFDEVSAFEALRPFPKELVTACAVRQPAVRSVNAYDRVIRYQFSNSCGGYEGVQFVSGKADPQRDIPWLIGDPGISRFRDRVRIEVRIAALEAKSGG